LDLNTAAKWGFKNIGQALALSPQWLSISFRVNKCWGVQWWWTRLWPDSEPITFQTSLPTLPFCSLYTRSMDLPASSDGSASLQGLCTCSAGSVSASNILLTATSMASPPQ
jgi:hypothetical protein